MAGKDVNPSSESDPPVEPIEETAVARTPQQAQAAWDDDIEQLSAPRPTRTLAEPGQVAIPEFYKIPTDMEFSVTEGLSMHGTIEDARKRPEDVRVQREELEFLPAPGIQRIAQALAEGDSTLAHLGNFNVLYLWSRGSLGKKHPFGKTQLPTGLLAYAYRGFHFIIQISAEECRNARFDPIEIEALTYHELQHTGMREDEVDENGNPIPILVPHDFEGGGNEIRRYGFWHEGARRIERAAKQLALPGTETDPRRRVRGGLRLAYPAEAG